MKTLIIELGEAGHRVGYVTYIMEYIAAHTSLHGKYTFILNKKLQKGLSDMLQSDAYAVRFIEVNLKSPNLFKSFFSGWKHITDQINKERPFKEVIFLEIDRFLLMLSMRPLNKDRFVIKGILFQPYLHYKLRKGSVWFYFRHFLKSYFFQKLSAFLNPSIERLFILNDKECLALMNKKIKNIFQYLPDPIDSDPSEINVEKMNDTLRKYRISTQKNTLLLFGSIDERKNLISIINALLLLPEKVRSQVHLVIAGKFQAKVRERFINYINRYMHEVSITYYDEFIKPEEREVLFKCSDLVLMPYINFYSSSGNLGHTIKYNKPVIVSNEGLISRIVTENNLGISVNPWDEVEIKEAILKILNKTCTFQYDSEGLLKQFSPMLFSKTLLTA